jgi:hypothetical protein
VFYSVGLSDRSHVRAPPDYLIPYMGRMGFDGNSDVPIMFWHDRRREQYPATRERLKAGVAVGLIFGVEPRVAGLAVLVIFRHALVDERRHLVQGPVAAGVGQGLDADILVVPGIIAFVKLVAAAEFSADRIP